MSEAQGSRKLPRPASERVVPVRPAVGATRRISVSLDQARYVAFKTFAALQGLTGEAVVILALDRLLSSH